MYNNKQYRTAQKSFQEGFENIKEYFQGSSEKTKKAAEGIKILAEYGITDLPTFKKDLLSGDWNKYLKILRSIAEAGYNLTNILGGLIGTDMAATKILELMGLGVPQLQGPSLKGPPIKTPYSLLGGLAGMIGAKTLMNIGENVKGDLAIYIDYMSDYNKDLDAIVRLYPKHRKLNLLINKMRDIANQGLEIIKTEKNKKASKKKNYRIAIRGEANWGSYAHQGLEGAAFGAGATKTWQGALASGLGFAGYDALKDFHHNRQDTDYQATAYAHELVEKTESMANQLGKYDEQAARTLRKHAEEFEYWMERNIYKPDSAIEKFRDNVLFNPKSKYKNEPYMLDAYLEAEDKKER
jgi:hypothetical protein